MGIVADAAVVNENVTGYILVVRAMEMEFDEIQWTVDKLKSFNANLVGFLLNDVSGAEENIQNTDIMDITEQNNKENDRQDERPPGNIPRMPEV